MEYRELIDAFAAKCGVEQPGGEDGVAVFEIDGMTVGFIHNPAEDAAGGCGRNVLADLLARQDTPQPEN